MNANAPGKGRGGQPEAERRANPRDEDETRTVISMLDDALIEHDEWLEKWHRAIVCRLQPSEEILDPENRDASRFSRWMDENREKPVVRQQAFQDLGSAFHDLRGFGAMLAERAARGRPVPEMEYDVFVERARRFTSQARRIREAFQSALSELDPLTGLNNRQVMLRELEGEYQRALRSCKPCCIALADIDHFKKVNDTHGHAAGDRVLTVTAARFVGRLRPYDHIFRYGGEEFLICLPDASIAAARTVLERLRAALIENPVEVGGGISLDVTASFGIAQVEQGISLKHTIERADQALYAAKNAGRDRIMPWSQEMTAND